MVFLAIWALQFPLRYFYNHYFLPIDNASLFVFLTTDLILAQILPQRPHALYFFLADFKWNMLGDSFNITNLCCNPLILKKSWQNLLKTVFLGPICTKKGSLWATLKMTIFFFAEIIKTDHQLSETFYFVKLSYVLTELRIFFYLELCFLSKKCHFQLAKTNVYTLKRNR